LQRGNNCAHVIHPLLAGQKPGVAARAGHIAAAKCRDTGAEQHEAITDDLCDRIEPQPLRRLIAYQWAERVDRALNVSQRSVIRLEEDRIAGQEVRALTRFRIDGTSEQRVRSLDDGMTALDLAHIPDQRTSPVVGKESNHENQDGRHQRQCATLR
jgi:hypothetical protein